MALILNIDTSTEVCSVVLADDSYVIAERETFHPMSHGSLLSVYIREILEEKKLKVSDLDAVAISKGPGSYTGLRIGVSTVKGLCYGAGIPLISVNTLKQITYGAVSKVKDASNVLFCPMIDARRMEVYTSVYNYKLEVVEEISAKIIDEHSFADLLNKSKIYFFGNGAEKCKGTLTNPHAVFLDDIHTQAKNMVDLSLAKFISQQFEDIAYFEPFYLKDFIATVPRKNILG